ncbi:MAG TPA: hypothetical protein PK110_08225 [Niabella sp.]|nr:hypothetical protein [Chitinophagaceae bacterium]HRN46899.1 hypothetical protein [Niabella sp.]HRO84790.1 hypothetical protein [Niabella sp.]HUN01611.1 hypothetical protein [Niabella sp.]
MVVPYLLLFFSLLMIVVHDCFMKPISILRFFLLLSVVFIVSCSKKAVDSVYLPDFTEAREWLRENGQTFKNRKILVIDAVWQHAERTNVHSSTFVFSDTQKPKQKI